VRDSRSSHLSSSMPKWLLIDVNIGVLVRPISFLNRICRCILWPLYSFTRLKSIRYTRLACLPIPITILLGLRSWWTKLQEWMNCRRQSWAWRTSADQVWHQKSNSLASWSARSRTVFSENREWHWIKRFLRDGLRWSITIASKPLSVPNQWTRGMPTPPLSILYMWNSWGRLWSSPSSGSSLTIKSSPKKMLWTRYMLSVYWSLWVDISIMWLETYGQSWMRLYCVTNISQLIKQVAWRLYDLVLKNKSVYMHNIRQYTQYKNDVVTRYTKGMKLKMMLTPPGLAGIITCQWLSLQVHVRW